MLIVWGKKIMHGQIGYVADFCLICREPRAMRLRRIGLASHVYYLAASTGELVGHDRTCLACKTSYEANPAIYASVSPSLLPLADLQRETFPNLEVVWRARLAMEERIKRSPELLSSEERYVLILDPLRLLSPKVEHHFAASAIFDREVGFAMGGAVLLLLFGWSLLQPAFRHDPDLELFGTLGLILAASVPVIWQYAKAGRRYMRREIIPALAYALRPLHPAPVEVQQALAELRQSRHKIAKKLRLDDLFLQIEHPPA